MGPRRDLTKARHVVRRSSEGAARAADLLALALVVGSLAVGVAVLARSDPAAVMSAAIALVGVAGSIP